MDAELDLLGGSAEFDPPPTLARRGVYSIGTKGDAVAKHPVANTDIALAAIAVSSVVPASAEVACNVADDVAVVDTVDDSPTTGVAVGATADDTDGAVLVDVAVTTPGIALIPTSTVGEVVTDEVVT